jgi:hypothetical protein
MEAPLTLLIGITSALGLVSLALGCCGLGKPGTYSSRRNPCPPRHPTTSGKRGTDTAQLWRTRV